MNGGSSKTTRSKAGRRTNQCSEPSNFSSTILGLLLIIFAAWIRDLCILRSMLDMLSTVELESLIGIVPSEWSEPWACFLNNQNEADMALQLLCRYSRNYNR